MEPQPIPQDKGWSGLAENAKDAYHTLHRLALLRDGIIVKLVEGHRSPERQAWLYAQGRTREGDIVTNAKPGFSKHESGRAFDVCIENDANPWNEDKLARVGEIGLSIGLKWGIVIGKGRRDSPHFECPEAYGENGLEDGYGYIHWHPTVA